MDFYQLESVYHALQITQLYLQCIIIHILTSVISMHIHVYRWEMCIRESVDSLHSKLSNAWQRLFG